MQWKMRMEGDIGCSVRDIMMAMMASGTYMDFLPEL
jgi:hypothetical protein